VSTSTVDYAAAAGWKLGDGRQILVEIVATFDAETSPATGYEQQLEQKLLELLPQVRRQATPEAAAREAALTLRKPAVPVTSTRVTLTPLSWVAFKPLGG
jgi:nitrogen fixation protein FixH